MMATRYEDAGGILIQAVKLGEKRLLEVILKWCSLLESNTTVYLPEDHLLVKEQAKYLGHALWESQPSQRSTREKVSFLGPDRRPITTEEDFQSWCENHIFGKLENSDQFDNPFMVTVLDPQGRNIGCFRENTLMVAEEWEAVKETIKKVRKSSDNEVIIDEKPYMLERRVVNR